jgi:Flp pilus assembly protein TadG
LLYRAETHPTAVPHRADRNPAPVQPARARDRGSISLFLAIFAVAALALLALLVDGGTAINARERAADIAEQAARAAANQIDVADLRSGNPQVMIGPGACVAADSTVAQYQAASHLAASVHNCDAPVGATSATVQVSVQTRPLIPLMFGNFTMTASATAYPQCGITQGGQC